MITFLNNYSQMTREDWSMRMRCRTSFTLYNMIIIVPNFYNNKYRMKTKARNKSRGEIFLQNEVLFTFLLNYMKCWGGQSPKIMGLHNSVYGAPLQIMQLYMNYGAPSPFIELHERLCIKIELYGSPLCPPIARLDICVFLSFLLNCARSPEGVLITYRDSGEQHGVIMNMFEVHRYRAR